MNENSSLTNRQLIVINHLICAPSIEVASQNARVSTPTIYKWLKDEAFKAELELRRDEVIRDALKRLKCAMSGATEELIRLTKSDQEGIRRLACKDIIEFALKSIELEDIEGRLEKVEKVVLERRTYK